MSQKPDIIPAIFKMKCPNCRKGDMYTNKGIFPLKEVLKMHEHCPNCGQKFELEVGFYYGTGFMSYALSVFLLIIIFVAYWLLFGFSYKDNSVFICLAAAIGIMGVLQPWLMRISRVLYLYLFVKYGKGARLSSEQ